MAVRRLAITRIVIVATAVTLALSGCAVQPSPTQPAAVRPGAVTEAPPQPGESRAGAATSAATPASAPAASSQPATTARPGPGRKQAQLVRVVDGDTLRLRVDGQEEPVRLIGLNTPESVDPRRPVECLGKEASARAAELLKGVQIVEVEPDPTQDARDVYARLLLYVWLPDGRLLNRELIASGYAHEYTFRVPYRFQAEFRQAQREAEAAGRGLWARGACENQSPVSRSTPAPAQAVPTAAAPAAPKPTASRVAPATAGRGVPPISKDDCPSTHAIKGNQGSRSTTDWIYHPPGSGSYGATDPEECFAAAADAEAAGYRAPRN